MSICNKNVKGNKISLKKIVEFIKLAINFPSALWKIRMQQGNERTLMMLAEICHIN